MPSSIFDPNYNPFTVDPGGDVTSGLENLGKGLEKRKKRLKKEEEDRKKREELDKNIPAL